MNYKSSSLVRIFKALEQVSTQINILNHFQNDIENKEAMVRILKEQRNRAVSEMNKVCKELASGLELSHGRDAFMRSDEHQADEMRDVQGQLQAFHIQTENTGTHMGNVEQQDVEMMEETNSEKADTGTLLRATQVDSARFLEHYTNLAKQLHKEREIYRKEVEAVGRMIETLKEELARDPEDRSAMFSDEREDCRKQAEAMLRMIEALKEGLTEGPSDQSEKSPNSFGSSN